MIDRYSISASPEKLRERFSADVSDFYTPKYNAAPSQLLPVITQSAPQGVSYFYWGQHPDWAKGKTPAEKIINIRAENVPDKPALKRSLMKTRCIVPADGFYAWKKVGKKTAIPYRFVVTDLDIFSFAGIWEEFEDTDGNEIQSFAFITAPSNAMVSAVQERMPIILDRETEKIWLNNGSTEESLMSLLVAFPAEQMNYYPVSPRINDAKLDVPSLIIPTPPSDQFGNLTLFD